MVLFFCLVFSVAPLPLKSFLPTPFPGNFNHLFSRFIAVIRNTIEVRAPFKLLRKEHKLDTTDNTKSIIGTNSRTKLKEF